VGKPEEKRPLGRCWNRVNIDITLVLKHWNGEAWTGWI